MDKEVSKSWVMNRIVIAVIITVLASTAIFYVFVVNVPAVQEALLGPQGVQGIQGVQGPTGSIGLQGPQGENFAYKGEWKIEATDIYFFNADELTYYSDVMHVTFDSDIWKVCYLTASFDPECWYNIVISEGHLTSSEMEDTMWTHNIRGSGGYCSSEVIGFGSGEYTIMYDILDTEGGLMWRQFVSKKDLEGTLN